MEEKKNPAENKQELSGESLEQVTGGCGEYKDDKEARKRGNETENNWMVPPGIVSGAAILIGGAWDTLDREKPMPPKKPSPTMK
ncbi:MAG: hypothetical protein IKO52_16365 [Clostridia bacterium]|nr:hypothetical protein [Clostridia bacterium]